MKVSSAVLVLTGVALMAEAAPVTISKVAYGGWPNCYKLTNGEVEMIVTTDVGPRVIRYGFVGGQNLFKEYAEQMGKSGEKVWQARGGHRVWIAPEAVPQSYALDNSPVKAEVKGDTIILTGGVEPETSLQKQIVVKLEANGRAVVTDRITNKGAKPYELAPWALTQMAQGGTGITGFPPRSKHMEVLTPTNPLVMWGFTSFNDPRWTFTTKYLMLRQDPKAKTPQKVATFNPETFGAYLLGSDLFIKQYTTIKGGHYPDMGASYETFTNADFLELETVGPLVKLAPGATTDHVERWSLHKNVKVSGFTDAELDRVLLPKLH
ncbi:MAG TPA: hypothetical protein VGL53_27200 [Bryobacteraceae bacterium]|jgi:hypothetical protein